MLIGHDLFPSVRHLSTAQKNDKISGLMDVFETVAIDTEQSSKSTHIRRSRIPISCTFCRAGKLKCDRKTPCQQCVKRNRDNLCKYASKDGDSSAKTLQQKLQRLEFILKNAVVAPPLSDPQPDSLEQPNLNHLEALNITELPHAPEPARDSAIGTPDDARGHIPEHIGNSIVHKDKDAVYIGATHWAALLNDVRLQYTHMHR
jgi:hypothetical protein